MVIGNPPRFMQLLAKRTKLAILGKGMQSACAIDPTLIRGGWKNPEGTVISLLIDETPAMMMYKNDQGQFLYTGSGVAEQTSPGGYAGSVILRVRSLTEFLRLATYRESTTDALARGRISIEGSLSIGLWISQDRQSDRDLPASPPSRMPCGKAIPSATAID